MKTTSWILKMFAIALLGTACSKTQTQSAAPVATTPQNVVPVVIVDPNAPAGTGQPGTGTGMGITTPFQSGSTVSFSPASLQTMTDYVATHPLNNPTSFSINVNLAQAEAGRYGGSIAISYVDNGISYVGNFKAGMGRNQSIKGMYDNGTLEANYNYWFKNTNAGGNNELVFTGFFEDEYGAITISLTPESTTAGNDAEPLSATYRGSIYYKNFLVQSNPYVGGNTTATMAQHSPYRSCWYTYKGPYDCRSNIVQSKCGLNPTGDAGYKLLGTFTGLNTKAAFNIQ